MSFLERVLSLLSGICVMYCSYLQYYAQEDIMEAKAIFDFYPGMNASFITQDLQETIIMIQNQQNYSNPEIKQNLEKVLKQINIANSQNLLERIKRRNSKEAVAEMIQSFKHFGRCMYSMYCDSYYFLCGAIIICVAQFNYLLNWHPHFLEKIIGRYF